MPGGFPNGGGDMPGGGGGFPGGGGGMPGGFGMGGDDVKLQYIDDDADSYSNIFGNAKSTVTDADQARLIRSLKTLSEGEDLEDVLDIDELLRYFVVHNYLVNGDSYTGAMVHNYYLHEADGKLRMIPWDYNLAFGTFQGSDATSAVNDPIDSPLSVSGDGTRPMADWIFRNEEYTELYHQYFAEFLDSVDIASMIDETYALIAPYVEKDPTAFCSYEEFETGVATLRSFCEKRTESVRGQLDGTIPSTGAGQQADSSALIDASALTLSDMGSMGGGGEGGFPGGGDKPFSGGAPGQDAPQQGSAPGGGDGLSGPDNSEASSSGGAGNEASSGGAGNEAGSQSGEAGDPGGGAPPSAPDAAQGQENTGRPSAPGGFSPGGMPGRAAATESGKTGASWLTLIISAAVLIGGLLAAFLYKRK
jgi:hypothetical protein